MATRVVKSTLEVYNIRVIYDSYTHIILCILCILATKYITSSYYYYTSSTVVVYNILYMHTVYWSTSVCIQARNVLVQYVSTYDRSTYTTHNTPAIAGNLCSRITGRIEWG